MRAAVEHMRNLAKSIPFSLRTGVALGLLLSLMVAAVASGAAKPNKPTTVRVGNLKLTFNGKFTPTALPKKRLAPIALFAEGKDPDGGRHPPAGAERSGDRNRQERRRQRQGLPDLPLGPAAVPGQQARQGDLQEGADRQRQDQHRDRIRGIEADPGQERPAGLQRRRQGRRHHLLHPRLHHGADPGGGCDHGEDQEGPPRPLWPQVGRHDPQDRRRLGLGQGLPAEDPEAVPLQGQEGQRPLRPLPRRQAAGPRQGEVLRLRTRGRPPTPRRKSSEPAGAGVSFGAAL